MSKPVTPRAGLEWTDDYTLTSTEVSNLASPNWVVPNLVIEGHVIALCAEPNAGKTTLSMALAVEMASKNYEVFYINADISASDARHAIQQAQSGGFKLLLPDFKAGKSLDKIRNELERVSLSDLDLTGCVFIIDTLKKFVDMIDKGSNKSFNMLLRRLAAKNATTMVLCHTNKHKDANGQLIFEGTGDLRADVDELIYLEVADSEGNRLITTRPDKVRGVFRPLTYRIDADRNITQLPETLDVGAINYQNEQLKNDDSTIKAIGQYLEKNRWGNQKSILNALLNYGHPERVIKGVLKKFSDRSDADLPILWTTKRGNGKEVIYYPTDMLKSICSLPP